MDWPERLDRIGSEFVTDVTYPYIVIYLLLSTSTISLALPTSKAFTRHVDFYSTSKSDTYTDRAEILNVTHGPSLRMSHKSPDVLVEERVAQLA